MKIALALSGGGFRATVFHLGVLARLAEEKYLEEITFLSTVSGGSLCIGLVHALNGFRWPSSSDYLARVAPEARRLLTTKDLQKGLIYRVVGSFWNLLETRADDLSALLQSQWGVTASLRQLPEQPRWLINATCYESGKNWRFERFRMGDYFIGYSYDTDLPLSDALAASSGFPGLIGPLILRTTERKWFKYKEEDGQERLLLDPTVQKSRVTEPVQPGYAEVHLWDGGVYDNNGLEGLLDASGGWRENVEFLIVSDATGKAKPARYKRGVGALLRLATGIMMDQVRSLRARAIMERLVNHGDPGAFLQTGNSCGYILKAAGKEAEMARLCPGCLSAEEADLAANMPTVIRKLTNEEFERLFRHGFEVADYTLYAYHPGQFNYIGYGNRASIRS
jgi:NTE family protein